MGNFPSLHIHIYGVFELIWFGFRISARWLPKINGCEKGLPCGDGLGEAAPFGGHCKTRDTREASLDTALAQQQLLERNPRNLHSMGRARPQPSIRGRLTWIFRSTELDVLSKIFIPSAFLNHITAALFSFEQQEPELLITGSL